MKTSIKSRLLVLMLFGLTFLSSCFVAVPLEEHHEGHGEHREGHEGHEHEGHDRDDHH